MTIRMTPSRLLLGAALFAITGCGGDSEGPPPVERAALSESISGVPLVGMLLADCTDLLLVVVEGFEPESLTNGLPLPTIVDLPTLDQILADVDLRTIPIVGGLIPSAVDPTALESVSPGNLLALLPAGGLSGDLPVLGSLPTVCGALPAVGAPTGSIGLVPVLGGDGSSIGALLAIVGEESPLGLSSLAPSGAALPLPATLGDTLASLLELLGIPLGL